MQSKIKTLINELNVHVNYINKEIMRALKIKLYEHTYQDTTETHIWRLDAQNVMHDFVIRCPILT